jgi:tetratricopeptide (TPR) repeat protein
VHLLRRCLEVYPSTNMTKRYRLEETAELLQRAFMADPDCAAAHAELSRVQSQMYWHYHDHTEAPADQAFAAAKDALRLKPGYARGHLALAEYWFRCRREDAEAMQELALARERTPRDPPRAAASDLPACGPFLPKFQPTAGGSHRHSDSNSGILLML